MIGSAADVQPAGKKRIDIGLMKQAKIAGQRMFQRGDGQSPAGGDLLGVARGELSPSEDVPARYRGWWPFPGFGPELAALRAGAAVGARLAFVDVPLRAALAYAGGAAETVAAEDGAAEAAYFDALARRSGFPSFAAFWDATFEAGGVRATSETFRRALLLFRFQLRR